MRVVVTGGAGFIGSHVAEMFLERGDDVLVVDDLSTGSRENVPERAELRGGGHRRAGRARGRARRRRRSRVPSRGAGERDRLGRGSRARLHVERPRDAERVRGGTHTRRAGDLLVDRRRPLRRQRAASDAGGLRAGAAVAVRRVEARRRGVRVDVGTPLRHAERRAQARKRLRPEAEPARRGRRRRDLQRTPARAARRRNCAAAARRRATTCTCTTSRARSSPRRKRAAPARTTSAPGERRRRRACSRSSSARRAPNLEPRHVGAQVRRARGERARLEPDRAGARLARDGSTSRKAWRRRSTGTDTAVADIAL